MHVIVFIHFFINTPDFKIEYFIIQEIGNKVFFLENKAKYENK